MHRRVENSFAGGSTFLQLLPNGGNFRVSFDRRMSDFFSWKKRDLIQRRKAIFPTSLLLKTCTLPDIYFVQKIGMDWYKRKWKARDANVLKRAKNNVQIFTNFESQILAWLFHKFFQFSFYPMTNSYIVYIVQKYQFSSFSFQKKKILKEKYVSGYPSISKRILLFQSFLFLATLCHYRLLSLST